MPGSRQPSANKLDIPGGTLTVTPPGQKRPADLADAQAVHPDVDHFPCSYEYLCIYQYDGITRIGEPGDEIDYIQCGTFELPNWTSHDGAVENADLLQLPVLGQQAHQVVGAGPVGGAGALGRVQECLKGCVSRP